MAETTNREAAETCLQAVSMAGHKAADDFGATSAEAVTCVAYAGIIAALLDVADAVREQNVPSPVILKFDGKLSQEAVAQLRAQLEEHARHWPGRMT